MLRSILHWTKFPENISKLFLNEKKKKNGTNDFRSHYIGRQRRQRHLNGPYMHTKEKQPFRSNSAAFIKASRAVYARIECEQTTAFELLKMLQ